LTKSVCGGWACRFDVVDALRELAEAAGASDVEGAGD
jgi:hypothetical protein